MSTYISGSLYTIYVCAETVVYIMHLSMYCPTYHPTGKRRGFDGV